MGNEQSKLHAQVQRILDSTPPLNPGPQAPASMNPHAPAVPTIAGPSNANPADPLPNLPALPAQMLGLGRLFAEVPGDVARNGLVEFASRQDSVELEKAVKHLVQPTRPTLQPAVPEAKHQLEVARLRAPLTYLDWAGMSEDEWLRKVDYDKRRLCFEREKVTRDHLDACGYWVGKRRWEDFKTSINDENRYMVKHIAMSHWMDISDFQWIARELPCLEELDLSDLGDIFVPKGGFNSKDVKHHRWHKNDLPSWSDIVMAFIDGGDQQVDQCLIYLERFYPQERQEYRKQWETFASLIRNTRSAQASAIRAFRQNLYDGSLRTRIDELDERLDELERKREEYIVKKLEPAAKLESRRFDHRLQAYAKRGAHQTLLRRLKWLGVRDWTDISFHSEHYPGGTDGKSWLKCQGLVTGSRRTVGHVADRIVRKCKLLKTLSIRGHYSRDREESNNPLNRECNHDRICQLLTGITDNVQESVTTLELRQSITFMDLLLEHLQKKAKRIRKIGVDIPAWIQPYSEGDGLQALKTNRFRSDTASERCPLDDDCHDRRGRHSRYLAKTAEQQLVQLWRDFNREHSEIVIDTSLDRELFGDPDLGEEEEVRVTAFPLAPASSAMDILDPFVLTKNPKGRSGAYYREDRVTQLQSTLQWLNESVKWRPIFSWDRLMLKDDHIPRSDPLNELPTELDKIRQYFSALREAGIPVHLYIGNRPRFRLETTQEPYERQTSGRNEPVSRDSGNSASSLYWGWPYDQTRWDEWLAEDFTANLEGIAPLVDQLSIFYHLRNPLDKERLERIDDFEDLDPFEVAPAFSSAQPSPQHSSRSSPSTSRTSPRLQIMANRRVLKDPPRKKSGLASNDRGAPPRGIHADDHPSDDSEPESFSDHAPASKLEPLHHLARRAAYLREAVGWQRFWAKYALSFTSLKLLRVRMPKYFDQISSWTLAKLLTKDMGWMVIKYADERQDITTRAKEKPIDLDRLRDWLVQKHPERLLEWSGVDGGEPLSPPLDLNPSLLRKRDQKEWPGGRFVRRAWFWDETKFEQKMKLLRVTDPELLTFGRRNFTAEEEAALTDHEEAELKRAIIRARKAAREEEKEEERLKRIQRAQDAKREIFEQRTDELEHFARERAAGRATDEEVEERIAQRDWYQRYYELCAEAEANHLPETEGRDEDMKEAAIEYMTNEGGKRRRIEEELGRIHKRLKTTESAQDKLRLWREKDRNVEDYEKRFGLERFSEEGAGTRAEEYATDWNRIRDKHQRFFPTAELQPPRAGVTVLPNIEKQIKESETAPQKPSGLLPSTSTHLPIGPQPPTGTQPPSDTLPPSGTLPPTRPQVPPQPPHPTTSAPSVLPQVSGPVVPPDTVAHIPRLSVLPPDPPLGNITTTTVATTTVVAVSGSEQTGIASPEPSGVPTIVGIAEAQLQQTLQDAGVATATLPLQPPVTTEDDRATGVNGTASTVQQGARTSHPPTTVDSDTERPVTGGEAGPANATPPAPTASTTSPRSACPRQTPSEAGSQSKKGTKRDSYAVEGSDDGRAPKKPKPGKRKRSPGRPIKPSSASTPRGGSPSSTGRPSQAGSPERTEGTAQGGEAGEARRMPPPGKKYCSGRTKKGVDCSKTTRDDGMEGDWYCHLHRGQAPLEVNQGGEGEEENQQEEQGEEGQEKEQEKPAKHDGKSGNGPRGGTARGKGGEGGGGRGRGRGGKKK